jgi:hypothetical protein
MAFSVIDGLNTVDIVIETDFNGKTDGNWQNAFIVFDEQDATHFKYAGAGISFTLAY